jgi:esterase/lipase superfamily enzyme
MLNEYGFKDETVIINVHGYRSEDDIVANSYGILERKCNEFGIKNRQIGFYWPASWSRTIGYIAARSRVPKTAIFLSVLIWVLGQKGCKVVLQGHSLGCKVILDAMNHLSEYAYVQSSDVQIVRSVVISAPAVSEDYFEKIHLTHPPEKKYNVFWSKRDPVLKWAYRLAPGNWNTPAMGLVGPTMDSYSINSIDMTSIVDSHSGYRYSSSLYETIKTSVQ